MILLTCARLPHNVDKSTLLSVVSMLFPHGDNSEYLKNIACRSNDASASESLFALSLVYELLTLLPRRIDAGLLRFAKSEDGKPYFKDSALSFNISHSHGYVACAVSDEGEVGIDIEASTTDPEKAQRIAERYFNDDEKELVRRSPESFAKIWCEKEAKAKFFGSGLGIFLKNEKNSDFEFEFIKKNAKISTHVFYCEKIPICLCTKDKFGTISFV